MQCMQLKEIHESIFLQVCWQNASNNLPKPNFHLFFEIDHNLKKLKKFLWSTTLIIENVYEVCYDFFDLSFILIGNFVFYIDIK